MAITEIRQAYEKVARYCGYQDRTEKEVRAKLHSLGITQEEELVQLIETLKTEKFLDEERYVSAFVRGRLIGKQWGKCKIQLALVSKGIAPDLICRKLAAIEDADYLHTLQEIAIRKKQTFTGEDLRKDKQKLTNYLLQKGYEPDLVYPIVQELVGK